MAQEKEEKKRTFKLTVDLQNLYQEIANNAPGLGIAMQILHNSLSAIAQEAMNIQNEKILTALAVLGYVKKTD